MKKSLFLSFALLISCTHNHLVIAQDQVMESEEAVTDFEQLDEATQKRMIKIATFLNLVQKAHTGEIDIKAVVYFALEWAQELEKSEDPADQELCKKLYQIIVELTENLQAIQIQEQEGTTPTESAENNQKDA